MIGYRRKSCGGPVETAETKGWDHRAGFAEPESQTVPGLQVGYSGDPKTRPKPPSLGTSGSMLFSGFIATIAKGKITKVSKFCTCSVLTKS